MSSPGPCLSSARKVLGAVIDLTVAVTEMLVSILSICTKDELDEGMVLFTVEHVGFMISSE